MERKFDEWLSNFKSCIYSYTYYVNFDKVYKNVDRYRCELNLMNSLIGSANIERDFRKLVERYPEVLNCIPLLLAVRSREIFARDEQGEHLYVFDSQSDTGSKIKNKQGKTTSNELHKELLEQVWLNEGVLEGKTLSHYTTFMHKTGLFDLISNHLVSNLVDYATGVEVGLDSNARKNRGGHLMEDIVEQYIKETGVEYYKEMYLEEVETRWDIDLSSLSNDGKTKKRFDYVVKTEHMIYAIETNFYASGGSKLNETARSYKMLAQEAKDIPGFCFVWITDGAGWMSARNNLRETFEESEYVYSLIELESGALGELFS